MEELKSLFGDSSLNYSEFEQKLGGAGEVLKLANFKSGNYVDKAKYEKLESNLNEYKTKYNALQDSTKGFEELKTSYEDITKKYNELLQRQDENDKMSLINSLNVNPKFAKFVYNEVMSQTNDKNDFKTTLEKYLESNTEFLNKNKGTFVNLQTGLEPVKTESQKMNEFIRGKR